MRRLAPAACLLAIAALGGCGGNDAEDARQAASRYVSELGARDGPGTCEQMTADLQQQFMSAVVAAGPQFRGRPCGRVMQAALDAIPRSELRLFADAEIEDMKVDGDEGTFRYTLPPSKATGSREVAVDGRVAKQDGEWRVSCCAPGQSGGG